MSVKMLRFETREQWLQARTGKIGGSDASAIMGLNPYKTNVELWEEKTGLSVAEDIREKPYVKYGTDAEKHLRDLFAMDFPQYDVFYVENNMWINDKYPFAHASLDGWLYDRVSNKNGILEIKTTEILKSMQKEKWKNRIPDNYYVQILHCLMVTEFEFVELKAQLKTVFDGRPYLQTKHYLFELSNADVYEDLQVLIEEEFKFYEAMKSGTRPPLILPEI